MLQIAGGILIAYLVIVTTPLWLPILLYVAYAALIAVALFVCYEYPAIPMIIVFLLVYNSKTVEKIGILKSYLLLQRKIIRKLKKNKTKIKSLLKGVGNLSITAICLVLCYAPLYLSLFFFKTELFSYLIFPATLLSCLFFYLVFIKYPHKIFIK